MQDSVIKFHSNGAAPARQFCTDCGVSRTQEPSRCGQACQFIAPDYPAMEKQIHGRERQVLEGGLTSDECFFGVFKKMYKARLRNPAAGAQWTGITTRLAERLLQTNTVDALLTVAPDEHDSWKPVPVLITDAKDVAACRGMRMGYAPLLALLDTASAQGIRRLAVIGIPCQVYALRALKKYYGFDELYVIGTPCSDNTSTAHFHEFLALLDPAPETITYLEFRADYHVEIRHQNGKVRKIPFLQLPISDLPGDFFPMTCRTCVDYTNALSDITVGYMAGEGQQWLIVRNQRGQQLLDLLGDEIELQQPGSAGKRFKAVAGFKQNVERAAGGLPLRKMPQWLRPLVGWLMPRIGPRGLEFARARLDMKAVEAVTLLRQSHPRRVKSMIPAHIWRLVKPYDVEPSDSERSRKSE